MRSRAKDDAKRKNHPLWSENEAVFELARVTAVLISLRRTDRDPIRALVQDVADHALAAELAGPNDGNYYDEIYRLVSFSHITEKARVLDAVAGYVLTELGKLQRTKEEAKYLPHIFSRINLTRAFDDYKSNKLKQPVASQYTLLPRSATFGQSELPRIRPDQFEDASRYLTGVNRTKDEDRLKHIGHYACYRYSVVVGHIAKSHFEIHPCSDSDPVCRFDNYFKDRSGASRNSSGIAFSLGEWIYFFGQLRREHALKILAIRATGQSEPEVIPALLMSKSITPLIGRAALQRLDSLLPADQIRIADERTDTEFSSVDFRERILPRINNRMKFQLAQQIVFKHESGKTENFSQAKMVQFLPSLMRGEFFLQDTTGNLTPFNPASHEHYPFNQALVIDE